MNRKQGKTEGLQIDAAAAQQVAANALGYLGGNPRYPAGNPDNVRGLFPVPVNRRTYYGDTVIADQIPGVMITAMEQRVVQPRLNNQPGNPALGLPDAVAFELGGLSGSTLPVDHGKASLFQNGTNTSRVGGFRGNERRKAGS